ncbi:MULTISPECIES: Maf family protein [unclassified Hyphomonas]|jgi:septum formation protein|uniref:Maf family protein n=1 Tax=unclassified Hyphomonas TaxID=2630699 RepID=UPI000C98B281|nr:MULTISPECIES: Maf family protein [unclassified Hyphomonas]MAL47273.1 septum formation protein Maf [Hyphomonas sp.]QSR24008.1 septum formation protein Maf [Hyphomonas sp. KY3]HAO34629.1 septum formation protein Maf [Hyphomonas sp.]HAQ75516.1 septum formation protein Maf [Hyphomonas sp.]HBJ40635.1 septum formation protein Maf [Hyphomonas sp.]|tara:strand:- start:5646 stop:6242 length:597 start_codon:yes stop_codon:yes gene_type:complete
MSQRIILASGSQSRRAVLTAAGIEADTIKPNVDEDAAKASFRASDMKVRDQAMQLAELKSVKISMREPGLVIGCDQMLSLDGEAFDKPVDLADARNHLVKLSGKAHTLETAIVISEEGKPVWRYLARPKLTVRPLSDAFIDTYVEAVGEPLLSTVGAYQLEGLGAQLFTRIDGDYFSILGLPLLPLLDYLRTRGVLLS